MDVVFNMIKTMSVQFNVNALAILGIIALAVAVRAALQDKYIGKGGYVLIVLVLGLVAGLIVPEAHAGWRARLFSGLGHAGVSSFAYQLAMTFLPGNGYSVKKDGAQPAAPEEPKP